jgi:hypothetical protein
MAKNLANKDEANNPTDKIAEKSDNDHSVPQRRIKDGIILRKSSRNMNLDRRRQNSERRGNGDPNYTGPARRYTIDRRLNNKDRRQAV